MPCRNSCRGFTSERSAGKRSIVDLPGVNPLCSFSSWPRICVSNMNKDLACRDEQCNMSVVAAALTTSLPSQDRNDQLLFPVESGQKNGSQEGLQPLSLSLVSSLGQPCANIASSSCLSSLQLCHSLPHLVKRGWGSSMSGWASTAHKQIVRSCPLGGSALYNC